MLYVLIPCLILLVVALILKKRESANNEASTDKSKKTAAKKTTNKTPTRSNRSSNTAPTATVVTSTSNKTQSSTPSDNEFKQKIEKMIQAENYFSAEAQINQALNQDGSQHELYLYLVEIHLAQKDEFATKQLINHLKSLGLYELADQALQKQDATQLLTEHHQTSSAQNFKSSSHLGSDAAFDALIANKPDSQQKAPTPIEAHKLNLSEPTTAHDAQPLDFIIEKKEPVIDIAPLDFTPTLTQSTAVEQSSSTKKVAVITPLEVDDMQTLEFSVSPRIEEKPATISSHFDQSDLIFGSPAPVEARPTQIAKAEPTIIEVKNDLSFGLDQSKPNDTPTNVIEFTLDTPATTPYSTFDNTPNEVKTDEPVAAKIIIETDPLAQSFPELLSSNEIELNLALAEQYIRLGAYDAAKRLINEKADQYSIEQRIHSEKLLNQLAS